MVMAHEWQCMPVVGIEVFWAVETLARRLGTLRGAIGRDGEGWLLEATFAGTCGMTGTTGGRAPLGRSASIGAISNVLVADAATGACRE